MALTRITKGVIKPNENYDTHNINSTGIVTATKFVGPFDNINVSGAATFSGNVSIAGTLTYEDVTNVDSVGIITAQKDLHVGAGVSVVGILTASTIKSTNLSSDRVVFTTSGGQLEASGNLTYNGSTLASGSPFDLNADLDVDGHTNLDNVSITGVTTFYDTTESNSPTTGSVKLSGGLGVVKNIYTSGAAYIQGSAGLNVSHSTDINGDLDVDGHTNLDNVSVSGITTFSGIVDAVNTPASIRVAQDIQHKGDANTKISFPANDEISLDTSGHDRIYIKSDGKIGMGTVTPAVDIHHFSDGLNGNGVRIENREGYVSFTNDANGLYIDAQYVNFRNRAGSTSYASINSSGNLSVFKDLDVDGHTELDNVRIVGVTTTNTLVIGDTSDTNTNTSDNRIRIGNNQDLQIFHGPNNSYIRNTTNSFNIEQYANATLDIFSNHDVRLRVNGGELAVDCSHNQGVDLYYDASTYSSPKLGTKSWGVYVNGQIGIGTATIRNNRAMQLTGESSSLFLITGHAPSICLNRDPDDTTDSERSFFGVSSVSNGFANGTAAGDTIIRGNSTGQIIFATGTSIRSRITSNGCFVSGNIGIGVDNRWKIRSNSSNNELAFEYATSSTLADSNIKMALFANGNIAMGPSNFTPGRHLHIKDSGIIKLENTSTGGWLGLEFLGSSGTNNYDAYMGLQDSDGLFFIDNNSNGIDFCIKQNGNIGMGGETNPVAAVTINKGSTGQNTSHTDGELLRLEGYDSTNSRHGIGFGRYNGGANGYKPAAFIGAATGTWSSYTNCHLVFSTRNTTGDDDPTERLRITNDGKTVAGGTGNGYPERLQAHGGGSTGGECLSLNSTGGNNIATEMRFYENGTGRFRMKTLSGNPGIKFEDWTNNETRAEISGDGDFKVYDGTLNWSTIAHRCTSGRILRRHYREFNSGSSGTVHNLIRVRRHYWGWGHYKFTIKRLYYSGIAEDVFYLNGHGRDDGSYNPSYSIGQRQYNGHGSNFGYSNRITITTPSGSSPGSDTANYVDVQLQCPAYMYFVVEVEASAAGYSLDVSSLGSDTYALHP